MRIIKRALPLALAGLLVAAPFASAIQITDKIEVSGTIEVEANFTDSDADGDSSDISLATAELGVDVQLNEQISGHLLYAWNDDGTDDETFEVDEAFITYAFENAFVTAGKLYVPFGVYETNMIQDPLTLEIGEVRDVAVVAGFDYDGIYGNAYVFNGEFDEADADDQIKCFGANLGYAMEQDEMTLDAGMGWINNILESENDNAHLSDFDLTTLEDYVPGITAHITAGFGPFAFIAEYVAMLDDAESTDPAVADVEKFSACNLELGFTTEIVEKETTFALGYQWTDDAEATDLPEKRYIGAVSVGIIENVGAALEYYHDDGYGEDNDADTVTAQLSLEF